MVEELEDRYEAFKLFEEAERRVMSLLREAEKDGYRIFFSPIIKSREAASSISPLYLDMVEDSVILYDKGGFFMRLLNRLRKRLRELGAERVRIGRKWYWSLKGDYRFGEKIEI